MKRLAALLLAALVVAPAASAERVLNTKLRAGDGSSASGTATFLVKTNKRDDGVVPAFSINATGLRLTEKGQAYGVWLQGGAKPHFLGFAPAVGKNGLLAAGGPGEQNAERFLGWLDRAGELLVTRETRDNPKRPGPAALRGLVPDIDLP